MDKKFNELLKKIYALLQPLGYRKEATNYRLFCSDGLCRIINIQRNKRNTNEQCEFLINIGVYFEKGDTVSKRNFKEYDCQIRQRVANEKCGKSEWWYLDCNSTIDELLKSMEPTFLYIEEWFSLFPSKEMTIHKILDGTAERYSDTTVMHFHTAKLLAEIGYSSEVYELIKDTKITHPHATMVIELAEQLKKSNIR